MLVYQRVISGQNIPKNVFPRRRQDQRQTSENLAQHERRQRLLQTPEWSVMHLGMMTEQSNGDLMVI